MATDATKRAYGPALLGNSAATLYTVGGSATQVIKEVRVVNETGTDATFTLYLTSDAAGKRLYKSVTVSPGQPFVDNPWIALNASDVVGGYSDTASALTITISVVETT